MTDKEFAQAVILEYIRGSEKVWIKLLSWAAQEVGIPTSVPQPRSNESLEPVELYTK